MAETAPSIRVDRDLTEREKEVVRWLLEHGGADAPRFLAQLDQARVYSRCTCGCASIDFAIAGKRPKTFGVHVLADFQWKGEQGELFGAFVFESDDLLAGLDLWSIDGQAIPSCLPTIEELKPFGTPSGN